MKVILCITNLCYVAVQWNHSNWWTCRELVCGVSIRNNKLIKHVLNSTSLHWFLDSLEPLLVIFWCVVYLLNERCYYSIRIYHRSPIYPIPVWFLVFPVKWAVTIITLNYQLNSHSFWQFLICKLEHTYSITYFSSQYYTVKCVMLHMLFHFIKLMVMMILVNTIKLLV